MIKKTITYTIPIEQDDGSFEDREITEDFYFHLTKAELIELEMSEKGGLKAALMRIVELEDQSSIVREFKRIILMAYGVRSDDNRRFIKNDTVREEFESSEAYSALFMELVTNSDAAVEFINGMIPANLSKEAARLAGIDPKKTPIIAVEEDDANEKKVDPEVITRKAFNEMPNDELPALMERIRRGEVIFKDEPSLAQ